MMDDVKEQLRTYILSEFLPGEAESNLKDDTLIRSTGIVDSMGMLSLIMFVEERFGVEVDAQEAGLENFDKIESIASLIDRKRAAKG
jgi:acyl carrier protein